MSGVPATVGNKRRNYVLDNSRGYNIRHKSEMGRYAAPTEANEEKLMVVPCRWSHTGWKYVREDP